MIRLENLLKISLQGVLKMSWKCLEDVFQDVLKTFWRHLEEVLVRRMAKTNILVLTKTSWRRLEDVFWRRRRKTSSRRLQDVFIKTNIYLDNNLRILKVFDDFKNNFKIVWSNVLLICKSTYILKVYSIHDTLR